MSEQCQTLAVIILNIVSIGTKGILTHMRRRASCCRVHFNFSFRLCFLLYPCRGYIIWPVNKGERAGSEKTWFTQLNLLSTN